MKKIVLSTIVALAATSAFAQSNVEIYGKMRIYQESYKAGTSSSVTQQTSDASRLGFKGTEDLGGGLKAFFVLETALANDAPTATTLGDRTSKVGLSTDVGSFSMGRDKHSVGLLADRYDAMQNFLGTSVGTIHSLQGYRVQNAVFVTASPVKNVTVSYQNSSSETAGVSNTQAGGVDVTFGNLSASYARYDNQAGNVSDAVGAKFNLESTGSTIFAMYSDNTISGVESKGKSIGINQKLGSNLMALASYGEKTGTRAYNAGLNYSLSKRTTLLARYAKENADNNANDLQRIGLGIEHNF